MKVLIKLLYFSNSNKVQVPKCTQVKSKHTFTYIFDYKRKVEVLTILTLKYPVLDLTAQQQQHLLASTTITIKNNLEQVQYSS